VCDVRAVLVVVEGRRRVKALSEALIGGRPRQLRGRTLYAVRIRWEQWAVVAERSWLVVPVVMVRVAE
jgi:hypothetical protein